MQHSQISVYKRLYREYLQEHFKTFLIAIFFMTIFAVSTLMIATLIETLIDFVNQVEKTGKETKDISEVQSYLSQYVLSGDLASGLFKLSLIFASLFVVKGIAAYFQTLIINLVSLKVLTKLKKNLINSILKQDLEFFNEKSSGVLISNFTNDIHIITRGLSVIFLTLGRDSLTLIVMVSGMFYQNYKLAFTVLFLYPFIIIFIRKVSKRLRKATVSNLEALEDYTGHLNQMIGGIRVIKSFCAEKFEKQGIHKKIDYLQHIGFKIAKSKTIHKPFMETITGLNVLLLFVIGSYSILNGDLTFGKFISFIAMLVLMYEPIKKLASINNTIQQAYVASNRLFKIIDNVPKIASEENAKDLVVKEGNVDFKNVFFSYTSDTDQQHINDINISISAGKKVAFVGPSGAGKTTMIHLLMRFYDVDKGEIQIDGQNIKSVDLASLRQNISLVSQDIFLFEDTIRNNICYGLEASEEDILHAAEQAGALEFIESLPDGLDTFVGERGARLSGGQKQRIAIARAFMKKAPILILDEATSALDTKSEKIVQTSIEKLSEGKTTIIIAHRLTTIQNADMIYLIDQGEIIDSGNHDTLLKGSSLYKELYLVNKDAQKTE